MIAGLWKAALPPPVKVGHGEKKKKRRQANFKLLADELMSNQCTALGSTGPWCRFRVMFRHIICLFHPGFKSELVSLVGFGPRARPSASPCISVGTPAGSGRG